MGREWPMRMLVTAWMTIYNERVKHVYRNIYIKWQIEERILIDAGIPGLFFNCLYDFMDFFNYEHELLE